jgi:hypothetical protein
MKTKMKNTTVNKQSVLMSLYDYFGKGVGKQLGRDVYEYAKTNKVPMDSRTIKNSKYAGKVMLYPKAFLDYYFIVQQPDVLQLKTT